MTSKISELAHLSALADSAVLRVQVWAALAVDVPVTQQERKRELCSELLRRSSAAHAPAAPRLALSSTRVNLHQVLPPALVHRPGAACLLHAQASA